MIYHHYRDYRGTELPYVKRVLEEHTRPEGPGPNTQIFSTLLFRDLDLRSDASRRRVGKVDVSVVLTDGDKADADR